MNELTPELIFTISSRIVEASTAGKDTAPGYRHGFIQGFAEAIEFIKTLDKRTEDRRTDIKRVRQNLCENIGPCDPNFAVNTPNCNDNGFAGEAIECDDPGFYQGTGRMEK